jgi:hypothetical protein
MDCPSPTVGQSLRAEVFDAFNHANFGQPGNVAGSPEFGRITGTRFATGESGSSRQVQFGLKLMFFFSGLIWSNLCAR